MSYLTINKQRGLTLVEIAIVLVIIGLLLGGILKGQELITSARVRSMADQNAGIQAAYYGFIDRYRAVPGDLVAAAATNSAGSCAVLGNFPNCSSVGGSTAEGGNGNNGRIDAEWKEASAVWAHLSAAGFLNGNYSGKGTGVTNYEGPVNPYGGRMVLAQTDDYQPGNSGNGSNAATVPARLNLALGNNVPVAVAREIDMKLDDSDPDTGVLRAALATGTSFDALTEQSADCRNSSTTEWDISTEQPNCTPVFLY